MATETDNSAESELLQVQVTTGFKKKLRVESAEVGMDMSPYVRQVLREPWSSTPSPSKDSDANTSHSEPSDDFSETENGNQTGTGGGVNKAQQDGHTESSSAPISETSGESAEPDSEDHDK